MAFFDSLIPLFVASNRGTAPRVLLASSFREASQAFPPHSPQSGSRLLVTPRGGRVEIKLSSSAHGFKVYGRDQILIEKIIAETPGRGHGDEAMELLKTLADQHAVHIGMFITPIAHQAMSMDVLAKWAAKHGFEEYVSPTALFWREPGAGPQKVLRPE